MKSVSMLAVAALALAHRAAGATCDESDAKKILSLMGEVLKDSNCLESTNEKCPNAKCAPTVIKVTSQLPDCSANGENPKATFEKLLADCKLGSSSAAAPFSTVSSAGVALSATAVTVAIMYM